MATIEKEFIRLLSRRAVQQRLGRWIPMNYWTDIINFEQETSYTQGQLLGVLKKQHMIDRTFCSAQDQIDFGSITRIASSNASVLCTDGKKRKQHFVCLETDKKKQPSLLQLSKAQKQERE